MPGPPPPHSHHFRPIARKKRPAREQLGELGIRWDESGDNWKPWKG